MLHPDLDISSLQLWLQEAFFVEKTRLVSEARNKVPHRRSDVSSDLGGQLEVEFSRKASNLSSKKKM